MRVLVLPRYERMGASSRVRLYQYLPYLSAQGIEFSCAPFLTDDYLAGLYSGRGRRLKHILTAYARRIRALRHARDFDLVWIEKEVFPWMPAWAERRLARQGIPYIVDYDDAIFHQLRSASSASRAPLSRQKIDQVMQRARMVVAGNAYLAERACARAPTRRGGANGSRPGSISPAPNSSGSTLYRGLDRHSCHLLLTYRRRKATRRGLPQWRCAPGGRRFRSDRTRKCAHRDSGMVGTKGGCRHPERGCRNNASPGQVVGTGQMRV